MMNKMRHAWLVLCPFVLAVAACGKVVGSDVPGDGGDGSGGDGPTTGDGGTESFKLELLAGDIGGAGNGDGTGTTARFNNPSSLVIDAAGNFYVADRDNSTIRKGNATGAMTTFAGSPGRPGSADGIGAAAQFSEPTAVAVDAAGNIYVADQSNHTIRKVTAAGAVTTLAGKPGAAGSADGTGPAARFNFPSGVAVDGAGNVYVADQANNTIRKITSAGTVTTLAGVAGAAGSADGTGAQARFNAPAGMTADGGGNLYVADQGNSTIRKITSAGAVTTLAGTAGMVGSVDGTGAAARFNAPSGVTVDGAGNVYVADQNNHTIRKLSSAGAVTTFAGSAGVAGSTDGGGAARFNFPAAVTIDGAGSIYVADQANHTIRRVTATGIVATVAGAASLVGSSDGIGAAARFNAPAGVVADGAGNVYVSDESNRTVRKITPTGTVTTLAGSPGTSGGADGTGLTARFRGPLGIAVDGGGSIYVADQGNNTIRKVSPAGAVTTLAGTADIAGSTDGTGAAARFAGPAGVALDTGGNLYVTDQNNDTIRKITPAGVVTTLAGTPGTSGAADGTAGAAQFNSPSGIAVDGAGNLYVADTFNFTIRKVTPAGVVTTLAGAPGISGGADGKGAEAHFGLPVGITVDGAGNVYVADAGVGTLRKVAPDGTTTRYAGASFATGIILGTPPRFAAPRNLAITGDAIVVVDANAVLLLHHGAP